MAHFNSKYSTRDRAVCMKLYCEGNSIEKVSELAGVPYPTVRSWASKYNWQKSEALAQEKVAAKVIDSVVDVKLQMLMQIKDEIAEVKASIAEARNPTKDKLYQVLQKYEEMAMALMGIQLNQSKTTVEHTGKIDIKLEDLL